MGNDSLCKNCRKKTVIFDSSSGIWVCSSCGTVSSSDDFRAYADAGVGEPTGNLIFLKGDAYKDRKIYLARQQIEQFTTGLNLSFSRVEEVSNIIERITEGEFGQGIWFDILIAAVSYIVVRKHQLPLSIAEISASTRFDVYEVGRMVSRVVQFLGLQLPEFDIVVSFDRAIRSCPSLADVAKEKIDSMKKQGKLLLLCCMNWFLTTGRRPLPIVAAVLTFVSEVNKVEITIEEIAKEVYAGAYTARQRYKELKETLVKAAQALPWGKDINVKNLVHNAPSILRYMEMKSKAETPLASSINEPQFIEYDLKGLLNDCMQKETEYTYDIYGESRDSDCRYFEFEERCQREVPKLEDMSNVKLSQDDLKSTYTALPREYDLISTVGEKQPGNLDAKRRRENSLFGYTGWWEQKSDLPKELNFSEMADKNIGFNALPPSFVAGREACQRRREKIATAKKRIHAILASHDVCSNKDLDWEDCIIELLLLHHANEAEIEQGHYNRLVDLHVFSALDHTKSKPLVQT